MAKNGGAYHYQALNTALVLIPTLEHSIHSTWEGLQCRLQWNK